MKDRKKRNIIIGTLCCLLIIMGIVYALLSQSLIIKGSEIIMGEWNVKITNMVAKTPVGKASDVSHSFTDTTASFEADLWVPGDSIEYEVTVSNQGNVKAVLQTVTPSTIASDKSIKFTHTEIPEVLLPGESKSFTLKVEFDSSATSIPDNKTVKYTLDVIYVQNDGKSEVVKATESNDSSCFMITDNGTLFSYDYDCGPNVVVPNEVNGITVKRIVPGFLNSDGVVGTYIANNQNLAYLFSNEDKKNKYFDELDKNNTTLTEEEIQNIKNNAYIYASEEFKRSDILSYSMGSLSYYNRYYKITDSLTLERTNENDYNIATIYASAYVGGDIPVGNYCTTTEACELLKKWFKYNDPAKEYASDTYYEYIGYEEVPGSNQAYQSLGVYYTIDELDEIHMLMPVGNYLKTETELNKNNIEKVDFSNATSIEGSFFITGGYSNVDKIILPPNVQTVFAVIGFNNVTFPKNSITKTIGYISSTSSLSINVPSSVKSIRNIDSPDYGSSHITSKISSLTFDENSNLVAIYGKDSEKDNYDEVFAFGRYGESNFSHSELTSLTIPKTLKYIGPSAFEANSITTLNIPSVKYLGDNAFKSNSITALNIPSSLEYLGDQSFKNNKISTLTFATDSNLRYIGNGQGHYSDGNVFYGNQLTSVVLPSSIEEIGKDSFGNNPNLKQITLTGSKTVTYYDRTSAELKLTDQYQLDVGTKDNPVYATVTYER